MRYHHKKRFLTVLFALCVLLALTLMQDKLLFENTTSSAPKGLYLKSCSPYQRTDYVIASLEHPLKTDKLDLPKGFLLLKTVQGLEGETYTVTEKELIIHGKTYPIARDRNLPELEIGTYTIPQGEYLLLNPTTDSLDSRYLGTIPKEHIVGKVHLLISYDGISEFLKGVIQQ